MKLIENLINFIPETPIEQKLNELFMYKTKEKINDILIRKNTKKIILKTKISIQKDGSLKVKFSGRTEGRIQLKTNIKNNHDGSISINFSKQGNQ